MMSADAYERTEARLELYRLLDEAEDDFRAGDRGISVEAMRERLKSSAEDYRVSLPHEAT